jgi:hypothetical protein
MKNLFNLFIVMLALFGVACSPDSGEENTNTAEEPTFTFTISNRTSEGATVTVTPSDNTTYYFDIIEKEIYDQYGSFNNFSDAMVLRLEEVCEEKDIALSVMLSSGVDRYEYNLEPDTEYYAYAFCLSSTGEKTPGEAKELFATFKLGPEVAVSEVEKGAEVSVTPRADNPDLTYYFGVEKRVLIDAYEIKLDFAQKTIEAVQQMCKEQSKSFEDELSSGTQKSTFDNLSPDEYYAYAFGVELINPDSVNVTTDITVVPFVVPTAGGKTTKAQPLQLQPKGVVAPKGSLIKRDFAN